MTVAPKKPLARRIFRGIAILAILGMLGIGVLLGSLWVEHRTEITLPAPTGPFAAAVSYGPAIQFVYTFPQPGRYQLWGQFKRNGAIVTVPVSVEVE